MIDGNLNDKASGTLKSGVGVYMGYSTTTDREEAVTDLAVMNERGNYSEGEYKRILEAQKKMYTDMVSDMKCMLDEYRANVIDGVPTAIQARDFFVRPSKEFAGDGIRKLYPLLQLGGREDKERKQLKKDSCEVRRSLF